MRYFKFEYPHPLSLDELNKERIKLNTEIVKLLTLLSITTGGGALALIVEGLDSAFEVILACVGTTFAGTIAVMGKSFIDVHSRN